MIKYICWGGDVTSKNDGDRHYVSARRLAELYRVPVQECILVEHGEPGGKLCGVDVSTLTWLHPDYSGRYRLPGEGVPSAEKVRLALRLNEAMTTFYQMNPNHPNTPQQFGEQLQVERAVLEWVMGLRDDPPDLTEEHVVMLERTVTKQQAARN